MYFYMKLKKKSVVQFLSRHFSVYNFLYFEHYQLWMMDSKAQSLITFLFYGWTEQPRPEKSRVVECVS